VEEVSRTTAADGLLPSTSGGEEKKWASGGWWEEKKHVGAETRGRGRERRGEEWRLGTGGTDG
jgi:hypothetical protein